PDYPRTVGSSIHVRAAPQLFEYGSVPGVRNVIESGLGLEWRYWSHNFGWTGERSTRRLISQINTIFANACHASQRTERRPRKRHGRGDRRAPDPRGRGRGRVVRPLDTLSRLYAAHRAGTHAAVPAGGRSPAARKRELQPPVLRARVRRSVAPGV